MSALPDNTGAIPGLTQATVTAIQERVNQVLNIWGQVQTDFAPPSPPPLSDGAKIAIGFAVLLLVSRAR